MKTVVVDAEKIMSSSQPVQTFGQLFDLNETRLELIEADLINRKNFVAVEVWNWPRPEEEWIQIADALESIQQHSNYFYLIWGTRDDMVNPDAPTQQQELTSCEPYGIEQQELLKTDSKNQ